MKHADAICSAYRSGAGPLSRPRTYGQVVSFVDRDLPLYEAALQKLEALRPPTQDEPQVKLWLAADRRVAAAVRALGQAALRRDFPGVTAASAHLQAAALASSRNASELGLQVCGRL